MSWVMYALEGNYYFPIYWSDSSLTVSGFDYDKLNALEIRALTVLDVFWVVKVKDFLHMAYEPKQISNFLCNAYILFLFLFDNLIIL